MEKLTGSYSTILDGVVGDAGGWSLATRALFSSESGWILWAAARDKDQNWSKAFAVSRFQRRVGEGRRPWCQPFPFLVFFRPNGSRLLTDSLLWLS